jgi:hypothetical protein
VEASPERQLCEDLRGEHPSAYNVMLFGTLEEIKRLTEVVRAKLSRFTQSLKQR